MASPFEKISQPVETPRATRTNINAALAQYSDLTPDDLRDYLAMGEEETARIEEIRTALADTATLELTENDKLTFGMIKPHREEAIFVKGSDEEIAEQVSAAIKAPLSIGAKQDIWIPTLTARAFYAHLPETIIGRVAGFMSSGASTGLVLTNPSGNAISQWRTQMGATSAHAMPEQADTLRYRFQTERGVGNNVTHGSDSTQSVKNELEFFREMLGVLTGKN
jgi:nucleoside diphosphate kinase